MGSNQRRSPHTIGITISLFCNYFSFWQDANICVLFWFLLFSIYGPHEQQHLIDNKFYFLLISTRFFLLVGINWYACISRSHRILCVSFLWQIIVCTHAIWQYGQILISFTIPGGLSFPYIVLYSFCPSLLHSPITE